jgi:dihydroflavonol-4-reductase
VTLLKQGSRSEGIVLMDVVTGATGHIGNVLVRELLSRGKSVRVLVLEDEDQTPLNGLDVEITKGDVRQLDSLNKAFTGADKVYHLAGMISILPGKKSILNQVNVIGTQNVITACLSTGINRLVYVSSIHAIQEPPHGTCINESFPYNPETVLGDYARSKAEATCAVLKSVDNGLDAVVVCPTGVIGPRDYRVSEMGQLIVNFMNKRLKASVNGAYDFVDVRDVARGIILAGEKGKTGESYILSGEQITVPQLLALLATLTGIKSPSIIIPSWLARLAGQLATPFYRLMKTKPLFTAYSIDVLNSNSLVNSEKARRVLGYYARPIRESITDAVSWFKEQARTKDKFKYSDKYCEVR